MRGAAKLQGSVRHATARAATVAAVGCSTLALFAVTPAHAEPPSLVPAELSQAGVMASRPHVAMDAQGDAVAVWERFNAPTEQWITQSAAQPAGGSWQPAVDLSTEGGQEPEIAMNQQGDAVAVWERGGAIQAAVQAAGGSWQPAVTVFAGDESVNRPEVAIDSQGDAVAVWEQVDSSQDGHEQIESSVMAAGGSWRPPVDISGEGEDANLPEVAVDSEGDAVAVWQRWGAPNNERIQSAVRPVDGAWQPPVDLTVQGEISFEPEVAMDSEGDATAVWEHDDGAALLIQSADMPAGGTWQPTVDLSEAGENAVHPQIAADPGGDAFAVWARNNGSNEIVQGAARPAGEPWQSAANLSEEGENAFEPHVAVDSAGDALAVWEQSIGPRETIEGAARPAGGPWQSAANLSDPERSEEPIEGSQEPQVALSAQDAAAVWLHWNGSDEIVQGASDDTSTPLLQSVAIPATGTEGQPVSFSVAPLDPWSALGSTTWSFGDGSSASGTSVSHTYTATGSYEVALESQNVLGERTSTSGAITIEPAPLEEAAYDNWALAGSLTPSKLGQTITLPQGSTFNGNAQLDRKTGAGTVAGNLSVPAFTASVAGEHRSQLRLAITLTQARALAGVLADSETVPGDETLTVPTQLNLDITAVSASGSNYTVQCNTAEPISLTLQDTLTREQVLEKDWSFTGTTAVPKIRCKHGVRGVVSGALLTKRLSGPASRYALTITAPG